MSNTNRETTTTFRADITELNKAFKEAQAQIKLANSEFKAAAAGLDDWSSSADGVSAKLKQLNSNLDSEKKKLESLEKQLARNAQEYGENSKEVQDLTVKVNNQKARVASTEKEIRNYNEKLREIASESDNAADSTEDLSKNLEDVGDGAEDSGSKLSKLSGVAKTAAGVIVTELAAIGGAAAGATIAIGEAAVETGAAFDSQMSTVKSISGATGADFDSLREKALEMGSATSFSATESAQALEYMAMAGWKPKQMISGLPGVMNLAAASGEDLANVSDIVTDAMTALGMKAEESSHFADVLAAASSSANTNVSLMGESFQYCAPVAGALGSSAEDLAIALGLMANSGIKGSQAGNSLKNALVNMSKPTDSQSAAMEDLGVEITKTNGSYKSLLEIMDVLRSTMGAMGDVDVDLVDSEGNMRDYDDIMAELEKLTGTTEGLTRAEQVRNAGIIFGKQNLAGMLAIINATDEDYQKLTESIYECNGKAEEMSDIKLDNLSGDITLFKSAVEGAEIAVSDQLSPVLRDMVGEATDLVPKAQDVMVKFGGKIAEIGRDAIPVIIDGIEDFSPILKDVADIIFDTVLPCLVDLSKDVIPLLAEYVEYLLTPLKNIASDILPPVVRLLKGVAKILKPILELLTPILDVTTNIAAELAGGIIDDIASLIESFSGGNEVFESLTTEEQAAIDKTKELASALEESTQKREESFKSIESEYGYYENLYKELDTIVDENGKIKKGYEDRAETIAGILSDAFDVEMEITGNQIQGYKDLKDSIYETIEAEKNKALLEAGRADYEEAVVKEEEARERLSENEELLEKNQNELDILQTQMSNLSRMSLQDVNNVLQSAFPGSTVNVDKIMDALPFLQDKYNTLTEAQEHLKKSVEDSQNTWSVYASRVNNWGEAIYNTKNKTEDASISMLKYRYNFQTAETANLQTLKSQALEIKTALDQRTEDFKQGRNGVTQEEVNLLQQLSYLADEEVTLEYGAGVRGAQSHAEGYVSQNENVANAAGTLSQTAVNTLNSADTYSVGEAKGIDFANGLIYRVQNGLTAAQNAINEFINSSVYNSGNANISDYVSAVKTKTGMSAPKTATGGIVTRAQTRLVGEDGAEAIIPLEKNTEWIDEVAARILDRSGSNVSNNYTSQSNVTNNYFTQNNTSPKALSRFEIYRQTKNFLEFNKSR